MWGSQRAAPADARRRGPDPRQAAPPGSQATQWQGPPDFQRATQWQAPPGSQATLPRTDPAATSGGQSAAAWSTGAYGQLPGGKPAHKPAAPRPKVETRTQTVLGVLLNAHFAWLIFGVVALVFMFVFPWYKLLTGMITSLLGLTVLILAIRYVAMSNFRAGYVAVLCLLAMVCGTFTGFYIFETTLQFYYASDQGQEYTNVVPSESSGSVADAGLLVFTDDTEVDLTRPAVFVHQATYCAAPIKLQNEMKPSKVQFWAVGKDCCDAAGGFKCYSARDSRARAGIVVKHSKWFPKEEQNYRGAVNMAVEAYNLATSKPPMLVRWVYDIDAALDVVWTDAMWFWAWTLLVFYPIVIASAGLLYLLARSQRLLDEENAIEAQEKQERAAAKQEYVQAEREVAAQQRYVDQEEKDVNRSVARYFDSTADGGVRGADRAYNTSVGP